jgi:dipeptidyl aminopeptidase/acylaminoacyl peptidase
MRRAAACGSWVSPIDAETAVAAALALSDCSLDGGDALWQELRPTEQGRSVVVRAGADGATQDLVAAPFDARTRVHEYGGRAYLRNRGVLLFSHGRDQRLWRADPGSAPRPVTPEVEPAAALRYADACASPDGRRLWAVREDHRAGGEPCNRIVVLDPQGDADGGRVVVAGADFVAAPRCSPDGRQLAWLQWNHPDMPWDGCELWLADLGDGGAPIGARRIAGGRDEAVQQPSWSPDGTLHFVSDRSGFWNLYRWRPDGAEALCPMRAEFGEAMWNLGLATYGFVAPEDIVCAVVRDGRSQLARLRGGRLEPLELPFSAFGSVAVAGPTVLFTAASPTRPNAVLRLDLDSGRLETLRRSSTLDVDPQFTSVAEPIRYPGAGGMAAHAFFYAPANRDFAPLPGEKPPLIVIGHGGPTSRATDAYNPRIQYWTSRGFAVLDVNYGGSTGFGRAYRQRLDGRWGVADVDDCVLGARFLVQRGDADPKRLIIRGSSAGGFTTLAALAFRDTFACGASHYGIGDLEALARDTHKFESRYLDRLVGPWPQARETYRARSPIHHLQGLNCPLILLQGADDKVVPPEQSRRMHAALKAKGLPVAYLEFAGEPHGFRQATNIVRALQAEAAFYARIFGFTLADAAEPLAIDNL